ncbi:hypothetical protein [Embleya sp. NPDC059237]|uniref:hypothetical protein n=1 Tax=Embleya sp. NPDC059237 TaxID=3346784 RepID=UPI0036B7630C
MSEKPESLIESLLPLAAQLIVLVHGDGGRSDIGEFLEGLSDDERWALLVVLAAMVNPDRSLGAALGWVTWDERADPGALGLADTRRIRDVAQLPDEEPPDDAELIDPQVLERSLGGEFAVATPLEQRAVVEAAAREGVRPLLVARGLDLDLKSTQKAIERARARLAKEGGDCAGLRVRDAAS